MAVSKVNYGSKTLLDLTGDTVTADKLAKGTTAHDKAGTKIIGTMEASSGTSNEVWVLNDRLSSTDVMFEGVTFTSNGQQFFGLDLTDGSLVYWLDESGDSYTAIADVTTSSTAWTNQVYRKLIFTSSPSGSLLTWLQANGAKQEKDLAIQPSKSLTITSNGTTTIAPDTPYDAIRQVGITVNASKNDLGYNITFPSTAVNWNKASIALLYFGDGSFKDITNYNSVASQTISNVIGMKVLSSIQDNFYVFRVKLSSGSMALMGSMDNTTSFQVTSSPNITPTGYGAGQVERRFWWPLSDIVLSTIEMYDTDD